MEVVVLPNGDVRLLYSEAFDLAALGQVTICRASHVEPDERGQWFADLAPVAGPCLGPFACRSQALAAEEAWLTKHRLLPLSH
jgi:hypothetical protein